MKNGQKLSHRVVCRTFDLTIGKVPLPLIHHYVIQVFFFSRSILRNFHSSSFGNAWYQIFPAESLSLFFPWMSSNNLLTTVKSLVLPWTPTRLRAGEQLCSKLKTTPNFEQRNFVWTHLSGEITISVSAGKNWCKYRSWNFGCNQT